MMLKRFRWTGIVLHIGLMLACILSADASAEVIKLQMALGPHVPGSVYQLYQEKIIPQRIVETVKGVTGQELEVITHTGLVNAADVLDAVRDGRVDMGVQGAMYRGDMTLLNALAFPAILPFEVCPRLHLKLEPLYQEVLRDQFQVEMLGMGYWPRQLLISKRPAATFADLKGLKFRTHSYDLLQLMLKAGGAPVQMSYGEVYLALQRGAIDGAVSSLSGIAGQKWYEVAKHVDWWPMGTVTYFFVMNKKTWDKLPEDVQRVLRDVVSKAGLETWVASDVEDKKTKEIYTTQYGCTHHYPPEDEIRQLKEFVGPIIDDWKKRAGNRAEEVITIFNNELGTNY
ncbi:MAG: TRAP transporter substrate-binding protein DctP [Desulfobacterales bacterium]|nr:MAG: TRAP transporter substrate-binding protein DctP [Desulfobacterales bacterium]